VPYLEVTEQVGTADALQNALVYDIIPSLDCRYCEGIQLHVKNIKFSL